MPAGAVVLEVAGAEADQDLVPPTPDAVVRRPAAEPAWLGVDLHVDRRCLALSALGQDCGGEHEDRKPTHSKFSLEAQRPESAPLVAVSAEVAVVPLSLRLAHRAGTKFR